MTSSSAAFSPDSFLPAGLPWHGCFRRRSGSLDLSFSMSSVVDLRAGCRFFYQPALALRAAHRKLFVARVVRFIRVYTRSDCENNVRVHATVRTYATRNDALVRSYGSFGGAKSFPPVAPRTIRKTALGWISHFKYHPINDKSRLVKRVIWYPIIFTGGSISRAGSPREKMHRALLLGCCYRCFRTKKKIK